MIKSVTHNFVSPLPLLQIEEEFKRITTLRLERTFLTNLDKHTPKLLEAFRKKGGNAGAKMKPLLDSVNEVKFEVHSLFFLLTNLRVSVPFPIGGV